MNGHDPRVGVWIVVLFVVALVVILVEFSGAV